MSKHFNNYSITCMKITHHFAVSIVNLAFGWVDAVVPLPNSHPHHLMPISFESLHDHFSSAMKKGYKSYN